MKTNKILRMIWLILNRIKKSLLTYALIFIISNRILCQTSIAEGFEGAPAWNYTTVGTVNNELARTGTKSLRLGRGNGGTGCAIGTDGTSVIFDPITLIGGSCTGIFTFYHRTQTIGGIAASLGCAGSGEGLDANEGFAVLVSLNNGPFVVADSWSGNSNTLWNWTTSANNVALSSCGTLNNFPNPYVYNVPVGTMAVQFQLITIQGCANFVSLTPGIYNRGDEGWFIDDVSFVTFNPCTLPVTILYFDAKSIERGIQLDWITASEVSNKYFTIERSSDGISFEAIGKLDRKENSNEKAYYGFIDKDPILGINYYRLKQTDLNGSSSYSKIVASSYKKGSDVELYPNPSDNGEFLLYINNTQSNCNLIEIFDYDGKKILQTETKEATTKLNLKRYGQGIYILKLNCNKGIIYKKLVFN